MVKLLFGNNFTNDIRFFKANDVPYGNDVFANANNDVCPQSGERDATYY